MLSLLLLALTIAASMIVVRIGAIALEITGLPEQQASFEALSSYSGTGFTTSQSEYAINSPQRKKIIVTLIRLGNAGVITTIATLGGTVIATPKLVSSFIGHTEAQGWEMWLPAVAILLMTWGLITIYRELKKPALNRVAKEAISMILLKGHFVRPVNYEEIWMSPLGNGFVQVTIAVGNPMVGKPLSSIDLVSHHIKLLSVERLNESVTEFDEHFVFHQGDLVNCFGPVVRIREVFHVREIDTEDPQSKADVADAPLPVGSLAPVFALQDQTAHLIRLEDYRGKKHVILYFYPKDKSFFCSAAMKDFKDYAQQIESLDTVVLAVNPDSIESHKSFCNISCQGTVRILSDRDKLVCKAYHALMLAGFWINRTVYIIDKDGFIQYAQRGRPPMGEILAHIPHDSNSPKVPEPSPTPSSMMNPGYA